MKTFLLPFLKHLGGRFAFEPESRRLFIPDGRDLFVINADTGKTIGEVPKVGYVSDIAFAPDLQQAFVVDSEHGGVVIVDLESLSVLEKVRKVSESSLATYDSSVSKVFLVSSRSKDCQIFDPKTRTVIKSVKLGGYPLQVVDDFAGHVYFQLSQDTFPDPRMLGLGRISSDTTVSSASRELAMVDGKILELSNRWKEPSCKDMRLIGINHADGQLFAACGSSLGRIDIRTGALTLSSPIPVKRLMYLEFDDAVGDVFAVVSTPPTLIALHENPSGEFDRPVIATHGFPGYMVLDGKTGSFFVLQSDEKTVDTGLYAAIPGAGMQPVRIPDPVPGTFRVVVYSKN